MKRIKALAITALFASAVAFSAVPQAIQAKAEEEEPETSEAVEQAQDKEQEPIDEVKEWFGKFFSADKVAMYMSWVAYIGTIIGLVANINKLKKANNLTLKNVSDEVKSMLQKTVGDEVAAKFDSIAPAILSTQEKTNEIMTIFAKILALSQENTPESRVAILNLIEQLGTVGKEVVEQAKTAIQESVELAEETKKQINEQLDGIIENYQETEPEQKPEPEYDGTVI